MTILTTEVKALIFSICEFSHCSHKKEGHHWFSVQRDGFDRQGGSGDLLEGFKRCNFLKTQGDPVNGQEWSIFYKQRFCTLSFLHWETEILLPKSFGYHIAGKGHYLWMQIPLWLAWAWTVHKLQDMELDFCVSDMPRVFWKGICYTGFSHAKHPGAFKIKNFDAAKIVTDLLILEFNETIANNQVEQFLLCAGIWFYSFLG